MKYLLVFNETDPHDREVVEQKVELFHNIPSLIRRLWLNEEVHTEVAELIKTWAQDAQCGDVCDVAMFNTVIVATREVKRILGIPVERLAFDYVLEAADLGKGTKAKKK